MAIRPREGPYREITWEAVICGLVFGVMLTACFTYAGLLIGFTIGGSAIAAILGFGLLRGVLGTGTIVENNINQTIASGVNSVTPGLIFTVPAFYLLDQDFNPVLVGASGLAGALLGILFIIPIRKQMIDLDRLRFPTGTAVAAVLKSPGAGVVKARLLLIGLVVSAVITGFVVFGLIPEYFNVGRVMGLPSYIENIWALSLFSLAAGFITGRPGLVVLAGGILAYWLVAPVAFDQGWVPQAMINTYNAAAGDDQVKAGAAISRWVHDQVNRPIGIGMLIGGAASGILLAFPSIFAALKSLRRVDLRGSAQELPIHFLYVGVALAFATLFFATYFAMDAATMVSALAVAGVGTVWLALAGIIVAQATGMTDWSPISGLALIGIVIGLVMTDESITAAIVVGAAVSVAIGQCADMMQDLKTGHLVGAIPLRQQIVELGAVVIGPIVCLSVIAILAKNPGFDESKGGLTAPQAQAVKATVEAVNKGEVPLPKYAGGAAIGVLLGFTGIAGLGVLVGLSMYLPILYILPYGAGCVVQMIATKAAGARWVEERGLPFAAGLLVGEPLVILAKSLLVVFGVIEA